MQAFCMSKGIPELYFLDRMVIELRRTDFGVSLQAMAPAHDGLHRPVESRRCQSFGVTARRQRIPDKVVGWLDLGRLRTAEVEFGGIVRAARLADPEPPRLGKLSPRRTDDEISRRVPRWKHRPEDCG
jgi:hypothetical protein